MHRVTALRAFKDPVAIALEKEIITIDRKVFGKRSSSIAVSYNKLGEIYCEMGMFSDAEEPLRKAVEIREALAENFETAMSRRDNLARVYEWKGDMKAAQEMRMRGRPAKNVACGNIEVGLFATTEALWVKSRDLQCTRYSQGLAMDILKTCSVCKVGGGGGSSAKLLSCHKYNADHHY